MKNCLEEFRDFAVDEIADKYNRRVCLGNAGILKILDVLLSPEKKPDEKKKMLQEWIPSTAVRRRGNNITFNYNIYKDYCESLMWE